MFKVGKFNLVDLAGSECIGQLGIQSNRENEVGKTLDQCINAIDEGCLHIPFRYTVLSKSIISPLAKLINRIC